MNDATAPDTPDSTDSPPTFTAILTERRSLVAIAVFALLSVVLCFWSIERTVGLSVFDEATHADYVASVQSGRLPRTGEHLSQPTLEGWWCRIQAVEGKNSCERPSGGYNAAEFAARGVQYNAFHPPLYYAITAAGAAVLQWGGVDDIGAAQGVGAFWLWGAMSTLYVSVRLWCVRFPYAIGAALALPTAAMVFHASTTVTNDAPAALVGAAAIGITARIFLQRNLGWAVPGVISLLAAATKTMSALPFLALTALLGVKALIDLRSSSTGDIVARIKLCLALGLPAVVVQFGWTAFQDSRQVPGYTSPIAGLSTRPLAEASITDVLPTLTDGLYMLRGYYMDPAVHNDLWLTWNSVFAIALLVAPFALFCISEKRSPQRMLAALVVTMAGLYPVVVQVIAAAGGNYFHNGITPRYGMTAIPVAIAALAVVIDRFHMKRFGIAGLMAGYVALGTAITGLVAG